MKDLSFYGTEKQSSFFLPYLEIRESSEDILLTSGNCGGGRRNLEVKRVKTEIILLMGSREKVTGIEQSSK